LRSLLADWRSLRRGSGGIKRQSAEIDGGGLCPQRNLAPNPVVCQCDITEGPTIPEVLERAQYFVGNAGLNYFKVGLLQLELLKKNGLWPGARVLEIGCGCLVAGRPLLEYLEPDRYVGIEPNRWLIDAVLEGLPDTQVLFAKKRPAFLYNTNFDAAELGIEFDFIISHSVLSHAAHWQCPQFLHAVKRVLAPSGVALASIRFCDENRKTMGDSMGAEWVYPDVSYFAWETIQRFAAEQQLAVEWRDDYREFFVAGAPSNYHDWIRLRHIGICARG
jgi:SAM-dependent methyltransferase